MSCRASAALLAVLTCGLSSCAPWTVRPITDESRTPAGNTADPAAYVESIWSSRLMPALLKSAVDARALLDALAISPDEAGKKFGHREGTGPWYFVAKGEGRVLAVNTASRAGTVDLDIAPFDGKPEAAIQTGPVLRGTALRDATGVVAFSDFSNQLQFADVGNALNDRVLKSVLASLPLATLKGRVVSFTGAFVFSGPADHAVQPLIWDLVPIQLDVEDGKK